MMARHPKVFGGTAIPFWFTGQEQLVQVAAGNDPVAENVVVAIPWVHHEVHEGDMFEVTHYDDALADDGVLIVATQDPIGVMAHFTFSGQCGGDATLEIIEDPTIDVAGTNKQVRNMNRNVADGINVQTDPTISVGTVVAGPVLLPGGRGGQAGGGSLATRDNVEWVTDPTKTYAVRLTNISGQARPASIIVNFYT